MTPLATRYAPSFSLVAAHFAVGVAGLCAFAGTLVWQARWVQGQFFAPTNLGLVHLCVLGWLLPIAIGALHQLVPVVFEVPVRSERLAWCALIVYVPAVAIFVTRMFTLDVSWSLVLSAALAAIAVSLYAANLLLTVVRGKTRSLTGAHVVAALGYLILSVALGAALAWNLHRPWLSGDHMQLLRAHAHGAALGFFGLLIMGVAYRLLEMFLLSHGANERAGWVSFVATNAAVPSLVYAFLLPVDRTRLTFAVLAAAIGVASFIAQVRAIVVRRMRRRLDVAWGHTVASLSYLSMAAMIGLVLVLVPLGGPTHDRLVLAYGLLALPGFIGSIVVGQMYKIVPFLVWLHRFSPYVGLKRVPPASELLSQRPQRVQYVLMHAGLATLTLGIVWQSRVCRVAGAWGFAASAALFTGNLGRIFARRP